MTESTFTPFIRRWFGNERQREIDEVRRLYDRVKRKHDAFTLTPVDMVKHVYFTMATTVADDLLSNFSQALGELVEGEAYIWELPEPAFERMSLQEFVEFRNFLLAKEYFHQNEQAMLQRLYDALSLVFGNLAQFLPDCDERSPFTVPLSHACMETADFIDRMFNTLVDDPYRECGMFKGAVNTLWRNRLRASGRDPDDPNNRKPPVDATDSKLGIDEVVAAYLAGSAFQDLFNTPVPLVVTRKARMSHTHIVGGSDAGKTTLIEHLLVFDLVASDQPSIVVIDPTGDLIRRIITFDGTFDDRLVYIHPRDVLNPPAINVFGVNSERMASYDEATKEQVTNGVLDTFDYLFSGLMGADLTAKQSVAFRYMTQLLLTIPEIEGRNATLIDMLNLTAEPRKGEDPIPERYRAAIDALPPIPYDFFTRDFVSTNFRQTKEQIRNRLHGILNQPSIARLFAAEETKIDLFEEMNRGSIILVDTSQEFLKSGSAIYGRLIISMVLQAIMERAVIEEEDRKDTFLYIDECATYFDTNIDTLLSQVRKYRCGCLFSHQYLGQAQQGLRASLASNTGVKFASKLSSADARAMAADMRTTQQFILSQPPFQFAMYVTGMTSAVSVPVNRIDWSPRRSQESYNDFLEQNRARVSLPAPSTERRAAPTAPVSPEEPKETHEEW